MTYGAASEQGPTQLTPGARRRRDPHNNEFDSFERTSRRRQVDDTNFISAQVGAIGEDAALLYDVVATAELDAARTPPSTDNEDDALALMALSRS